MEEQTSKEAFRMTDKGTEHNSTESSASAEALVRLWREMVVGCAQRFNIDSVILKMSVNMRREQTTAWPESFRKRVIIYNDTGVCIPDIRDTPAALIRAILAREAFFHLMPVEVLSSQDLFDMACEYGCQQLNGKDIVKWKEAWSQNRHGEKIGAGGIYDPCTLYSALTDLTDGEGLEELVRRLQGMKRYGFKVDHNEWAGYLLRFLRDYNRPLTEIEVRVIRELLYDAHFTRKEIAWRLGVGTDWVGKTMQVLRRRRQLQYFERITFPALGIRAFQLIMQPCNNKRYINYYRFVDKCPFVYSSHKILTGRGGIFITLCIPDNRENISQLEEIIRVATENDIDIIVLERHRSAPFYNLDCYNHRTGQWEIDWSLLQMEVESVARTGEEQACSEILPEPPQRIKECDSLDAQILVEVQRNNMTIEGIRKSLKRQTTVISEHLRYLRQMGVIKRFCEMHYVGLSSEAVVIAPDATLSRVFVRTAKRLPKCFLDMDQEERTVLRAQLPPEGTVALLKVFGSMERPPLSFVLDSRIYGGWQLSDFIEDWDFYTGTWTPHERGIDI